MKKKLIPIIIILLCGNLYSQEKLTYSESDIRAISPDFEVIMDSVINGKQVLEIGYINSDSTYLPYYGMWYYLLNKNSCFLTMFRPENEAARLDHIRFLGNIGEKISDTKWIKQSPYGKITVTLSKDNIGYHFDYIIRNEDRQ